MLVTSSTWATVDAQTTGEPESTQTWCQTEKDELKNRFTDLILLLFKQGAALDETIDMRDKGKVLAAEAYQRALDCADYLTGAELEIMQQIHDGSIFASCMSESTLRYFGVSDGDFFENYYTLVNAATNVTESYHKEIEKWERGSYDDREIVGITNSYLSQFDQLVYDAININAPENYKEALDLYLKSLTSERSSYAVFRDFVENGDPQLNKTSVDLLSNATKYELESFALVNEVRNTQSNASTSTDPFALLKECLAY
jgi:hypothetical protein